MKRWLPKMAVLSTSVAAASVVMVGVAAADYESGTKYCSSTQTPWTQTRSIGQTYATPPGYTEQYVGNFSTLTTRKKYGAYGDDGFWDATAQTLNGAQTYPGCSNIPPLAE